MDRSTGGDGLYIMDMRTGQVAVFTYDPASRGALAYGELAGEVVARG